MAVDDPIEMIWTVYEIGHPVGTHLSEATGSLLAFKNGTNELLTHAVRGRRIEQSLPRSAKAAYLAVGVAVGAASTAGAVIATPRVKAWRSRRQAQRVLRHLPVDAFCAELDVALNQGTVMSSAEAQRRLLEVLGAAAIIAQQMRALSDARIEGDATPELRRAMEQLTVPGLTDAINRMLECDPSLLDNERAATFLELFGGRTDDGDFLPLRNARVADALRLTQPEQSIEQAAVRRDGTARS